MKRMSLTVGLPASPPWTVHFCRELKTPQPLWLAPSCSNDVFLLPRCYTKHQTHTFVINYVQIYNKSSTRPPPLFPGVYLLCARLRVWGGGGVKVFLSFLLEDHLMFSVAVRSSLARILSQVQWWSVSMVTRYYVIRRSWWSHFEWKLMFFQLFSTKKVNLVAKTVQSAQLHILYYFSSQAQKITISWGFNLISNTC